MRLKCILILLVGLLIGKAGLAQQTYTISGKSLTQLKEDIQPTSLSLPNAVLPISGRALARRDNSKIPMDITRVEVPKAYSFDHLGLFCKWEVKMEKAAGLPVKFRLGEVQYVERMEGKYD
jgi:hypothetical protein